MSYFKRHASLLGIVLTFLVPLLLALYCYFIDASFLSSRTRGQFIQEPWRWQVLSSQIHQAGDVAPGHWQLVWRPDPHHLTEAALKQMANVHKALGRDYQRIQRVVITENSHQLHDYDPELVVLSPVKTTSTMKIELNAVYIVDPHGLFILKYQGPHDGKNIYHDMKRLLKVSQIG